MVLNRVRSSDERGATLVLVALLLTAFFAMTALVVDLGNARQVSRHSQASVDAGALAGAPELPSSSAATKAAAESAVARYVNQNLTGNFAAPSASPSACPSGAPSGSACYALGDARVAVKTPYNDASAIPPERLIYVRACQPTETFFAGVIGATSPNVCRESVARNVDTGAGLGMGVIAMHPTACPGLEFGGNSSTVVGGAVLVRSSCSSQALRSNGGPSLSAEYIGVVGGANVCGTCTSVPAETGIDPFDDPFLAKYPAVPPVPTPTRSSCGSIMQPGYYPNSCKVTSDTVLRPGVYYFLQGFDSSGNGALVCDSQATPDTNSPLCTAGVTFVLAGGESKFNGNGKVFLPPPPSGMYAGLSIYQPAGNASTLTINGTDNSVFGTVYAPGAHLKFTGTGDVQMDGTMLGRTIDLSGTFDLTVNVPPTGPHLPSDADIGLEH